MNEILADPSNEIIQDELEKSNHNLVLEELAKSSSQLFKEENIKKGDGEILMPLKGHDSTKATKSIVKTSPSPKPTSINKANQNQIKETFKVTPKFTASLSELESLADKLLVYGFTRYLDRKNLGIVVLYNKSLEKTIKKLIGTTDYKYVLIPKDAVPYGKCPIWVVYRDKSKIEDIVVSYADKYNKPWLDTPSKPAKVSESIPSAKKPQAETPEVASANIPVSIDAQLFKELESEGLEVIRDSNRGKNIIIYKENSAFKIKEICDKYGYNARYFSLAPPSVKGNKGWVLSKKIK